MKILILLPSFLWLGCSHTSKSSVKITDEYIEIKNDSLLSVIYEVDVLKFDSVYHYPSDEKLISVYSIVDRQTHKPPNKKSPVRMYFSKYNDEYNWEVMKDPTLATYTYQDTLSLKSNTWYKIRNEKESNELYFYWNGNKGGYITKVKPLPGPGPY